MSQPPSTRFLATTAWTLLWMAQAHAADAVSVLAQQRDQIETSEARVAHLKAHERSACDSANAALASFVALKKADDSALNALAQQALQARDACARARSQADDAEAAARSAWAGLRGLVTGPGAPAPLLLGVSELVAKAALAQKRVDKARGDYADPYEAGDAASAAVLAGPGLDAQQRADLANQAQKARDSAAKVRRAITAAQRAANLLVAQALELRKCEPDPGCTDSAVQSLATTAYRQMDDALGVARSEFEQGKLAGLFAQVGVTYPKDEVAQSNAIAFARLLDTFPDARSALGEESAFGLSAIGTSKLASIKLGGARNLPYGWRQTSFTLNAPLDGSDSAQLYTRGKGFDNAASLSASTYWVLGGSRGGMFAGKTYLTAAGIKASVGLGGKHSYRGDDLKPREAERLLREGSVGGYVTLFRQARDDTGNPVGEPSVHVFSVDAKRAAELGTKTTRCPAPATGMGATLDCVNDYFVAPRFGYSRLFSYEYRIQRPTWAFAPKVQYEDASQVTTVRTPFYLIRSGDPGAKQAFNAGIELVWTRGRDESGKRTTDRTLGVFVGLPFSMGEVRRD